MKTRFFLPESNRRKEVEESLRQYFDGSYSEHLQHSYEWTRTHWFLQGVRRLNLRNWGAGQSPGASQLDGDGQRRVRVETTLGILQTEMGRLMSIDLGPYVPVSTGLSLDGLRSRASSNAALDGFYTRWNSNPFKTNLAYMLPSFGTVGAGGFDCDDVYGGIYGATVMSIPPWELRPLPGGVTSVDDVAGVAWSRWVSYDWLLKNYKDLLELPKDPEKHGIKFVTAPVSAKMNSEFAPTLKPGTMGIGPAVTPTYPSIRQHYPSGSADQIVSAKHVEFKQGWVYGDDYSCLRFVVLVDNKLVLDIDYTNPKDRGKVAMEGTDLPMAPLHVMRYLPVGSFWGRGLIDREIPLNKELELAIGDLIQANRDSTKFTKLMVPLTAGINERALEAPNRNGILRFAPDPNSPQIQPYLLAPTTERNKIMGQTIGMLGGLMKEVALQGPTFAGGVAGRLDSSGAVAQVRQDQNIPLLCCSESITAGMTGVYKSVLGIMRRRFGSADAPTLVSVNRVDDSILGVTLDLRTKEGNEYQLEGSGKVIIPPDAIPLPQDVAVTIRSGEPVDRQARAMQLKENLSERIVTPTEYRILAFKNGLDNNVILNKSEYLNYVSAWRDCILLYGDGESPGKAPINDETVNHSVSLMVVMEVMASPLFMLASPGVRNAFLMKKQFHMSNLGAMPDRMSNFLENGQVAPMTPEQSQLMGMGMPPQPGQTPPTELSPMF